MLVVQRIVWLTPAKQIATQEVTTVVKREMTRLNSGLKIGLQHTLQQHHSHPRDISTTG